MATSPLSSPAQGRSTGINPSLQGFPRDSQGFTSSTSVQQESAFFNSSPTSTIASIPSRMPSRATPSMGAVAPQQKRIVIRSDPSLATCFDPADKELYDLWAPR